GRNPRRKFRFLLVLLEMKLIESSDEIEPAALMSLLNKSGRSQINNGIAMIAKRGSLVNTRDEAGTPVLRTSERTSHAVKQDHKGGQVLVLSSQPIDSPRSQARPAGLNG